jgi:hypothetical protein
MRAGQTTRTVGVGAALAAAAAVVGGCGAGGVLRNPFNPQAWSYQSKEDEPATLQVVRPVAIAVDSFSGDVTIVADERLAAATVTVRREATHGYKRKKEARRSLAEIDYSVEVVPGEVGPVLQVRTWTSHAEPHFHRAHLRIDVPAVDGLTVRTRQGRVEATDIEGAVHIESSGGDVRIMTDRPMRRAVTVLTSRGDIDYRVRGESTGSFDCRAIRGEADYRVRYGRMILHSATGDALRATLNDGENPVQLRTTDGDIRIAVVHNPKEVGTTIIDP